MKDSESPSGQRLKSPLLYQLSYRDEHEPVQAESTTDTPTESAGVGGLLGVVVRLIAYDPDTGKLTWRVARRKCRAGAECGSLTDEGYVRVDLNGRTLAGHRLAWMLQTGTMPPDRIDHINGDRTDNRWANLRAATATENAWNSEQAVRATGVWRRYGKIYGRIRHSGKVISTGPFATEAACTAWYRETLATLRGAFTPLVLQVRGVESRRLSRRAAETSRRMESATDPIGQVGRGGA